MKELLLIFITLITLANVSYASFPITEDNTVLTAQNLLSDEDEEEEPSWMVFIYILNAIIVIGGFFLLLRLWWRAWKDEVKWVRIFTYVILGILSLMLLLGVICGAVKGGCVYNMQ